jgi:L-ribulose-5-phosphate 3-epimerase
MKIGRHDIGVCGWSLRAGSTGELVDLCRDLGLGHLQLGLAPYLSMDPATREREIATLREAGIILTAGMISFAGEDYSTIAVIRQTGGVVPDEKWPERRAAALAAGDFAHAIGLGAISTHIGFIPRSGDARYRVTLERVAEIARHYDALGLELLMETGQERATELLQFLNDVPAKNLAVNFDPANMILYGAGDPVEAVRVLGRHIHHVHIKDATLSDQPGLKWGREVPFGQGHVDVPGFLTALQAVGYAGPLLIEREAGSARVADVRSAIETLLRVARELRLSTSE